MKLFSANLSGANFVLTQRALISHIKMWLQSAPHGKKSFELLLPGLDVEKLLEENSRCSKAHTCKT